MQMLQGNGRPVPSGKCSPALPACHAGSMVGASSRRKNYSCGPPMPLCPSMGSCLHFLATRTCHHAQGRVGYPLHLLFSSGRATQLLQASCFWH